MRLVRWAIIWTRSVQYINLIYNILFIKNNIYLLCIWPHIIYIILLIIGVWTISFSGKKKKRFTCDHTWKVCVIKSYLFWITYDVNNMNTQIKEKVLARLGRLRLQGALAPANFILNLRFKMKKPCFFPLTLWTTVNERRRYKNTLTCKFIWFYVLENKNKIIWLWTNRYKVA